MFVKRNATGKIIMAAGFTPGVTEEEIADDDPELVLFMAPSLQVPTISRRQFFQQAANANIISEEDALAAVTTGTLPAAVTAFIDELPTDQRFGAKMLFSVNEFERASPLANLFGTAIGMTDEQVDTFFMQASKL